MKNVFIGLVIAAIASGCVVTSDVKKGCSCGCPYCCGSRMGPDAVPEGANTLTAQEKSEGYELLFDGKNLPADKWVGVKEGCTNFPAKGWFVKDGCLTMRPLNGIHDGKWFPLPPEDQKLGGGGDICTKKMYKDFCFKFDFRLTEAANSGVKYFFDETANKGTCEEYQVLDAAHPDSTKGRDGNRRVAALYDLFPANAEKVVRPLDIMGTILFKPYQDLGEGLFFDN